MAISAGQKRKFSDEVPAQVAGKPCLEQWSPSRGGGFSIRVHNFEYVVLFLVVCALWLRAAGYFSTEHALCINLCLVGVLCISRSIVSYPSRPAPESEPSVVLALAEKETVGPPRRNVLEAIVIKDDVISEPIRAAANPEARREVIALPFLGDLYERESRLAAKERVHEEDRHPGTGDPVSREAILSLPPSVHREERQNIAGFSVGPELKGIEPPDPGAAATFSEAKVSQFDPRIDPSDPSLRAAFFLPQDGQLLKDKFLKRIMETSRQKAKKPLAINPVLSLVLPGRVEDWILACQYAKIECVFIFLTPNLDLIKAMDEAGRAGLNYLLVPPAEMESRLLYLDLLMEIVLLTKKRYSRENIPAGAL